MLIKHDGKEVPVRRYPPAAAYFESLMVGIGKATHELPKPSLLGLCSEAL
jgi:hypothetical protein